MRIGPFLYHQAENRDKVAVDSNPYGTDQDMCDMENRSGCYERKSGGGIVYDPSDRFSQPPLKRAYNMKEIEIIVQSRKQRNHI